MDLGVGTQAPREYCFSVFVESKKLWGQGFGMTKALESSSPSVGQFACFLALPAINVGLQPYQIRILCDGTYGFAVEAFSRFSLGP